MRSAPAGSSTHLVQQDAFVCCEKGETTRGFYRDTSRSVGIDLSGYCIG